MNQMSVSPTPVDIILASNYIEKFDASFMYMLTVKDKSYAIIQSDEFENLYILRIEKIGEDEVLNDIESEEEFQSVLICFQNVLLQSSKDKKR